MSRKAHSHSPWTTSAISVLGQQISAERRDKRWTQEDLAERAGISAKTLSAIEKGSPNSSIGTVFEVASLLGIPLVGATDSVAQQSIKARLAILPARVREPKAVDNDF